MKKIMSTCLTGILVVSTMGQIARAFHEMPPPEGDVYTFTNGVKVLQTLSKTLGQPLVWTTHLTNSSHIVQTCELSTGGGKVSYNGQLIKDLGDICITNVLVAGASTNIVFSVSPEEYLPWVCGGTVLINYGTTIKFDDELWLIGRQIGFKYDNNILTLQPATPILQLGKTVKTTVHYENPLPVPLHNVCVRISGMWGFSDDGEDVDNEWQLGTIQPNAAIYVEKVFTAKKSDDDAYIVAIISSDELKGLRQEVYIKVVK